MLMVLRKYANMKDTFFIIYSMSMRARALCLVLSCLVFLALCRDKHFFFFVFLSQHVSVELSCFPFYFVVIPRTILLISLNENCSLKAIPHTKNTTNLSCLPLSFRILSLPLPHFRHTRFRDSYVPNSDLHVRYI